MIPARTRFIVVDQNLRSFEGHHHDYKRAVVEAAKGFDLDTGVIAVADYPHESIGGAPIVGKLCVRLDRAAVFAPQPAPFYPVRPHKCGAS